MSRRPPSVPINPKEELNPKSYHFDMKLKPETVPTWDGNENTLARWIEKVGQLVNTSPDSFKELGKVLNDLPISQKPGTTYGAGLGYIKNSYSGLLDKS